ncbi:DNA ligase D [Arsenicitalea aurantiaca]|uniref:DNA ligase (ATP) n=1 Tax=Arsenicitalea aurantiaca TaxID=1783274 RepID=A0A433XK50_9HYPH|nr:DNA ligase D [Arsenicitalea aurantiaca]RUT34456.1 DNA ligase D [Arsenicitalea aurantiaca]
MAVRAETLLKDYRAKRDFARTKEPDHVPAKARGTGTAPIFVVQKHDATRLHFDFRFEFDGVLKSWAVTRGPSSNPKDKRLAVRVEDHPLAYADFEGVIPAGEYGGGTVMLWDIGTWSPIEDVKTGLAEGKLKLRLDGQRMKGDWALVRMKPREKEKRENWLLIKEKDLEATEEDVLVPTHLTSVASGRTLEEIAAGKPGKTKTKPGKKPRAEKLTRKAKEPSTRVWTGGKAVALPAFRQPQLATLVDDVPEGRDWVFEMKYDGYRALAAIAGPEVRLFTRNGKDWTTQFGRLVEPLSRLTRSSALIDGEICAFDDKGRTDFSTLKDALSNGKALVYFAFDLLEADGEDLTRLPLTERKARLEALLGTIGRDAEIQYSEHVTGNGRKVLDTICREGHEGIIAKKADAPYRSERTRGWLKIKCSKRQEFVIAGWRPSDKRRGFASLLLGTYEDGVLTYRGRVGTGFSGDDLETLQSALDARAIDKPAFAKVPRDIARAARWVRPELVAEIAFTEFTPDGVLRHPSFLGLRTDKPAEEITREDAAPADVEKKPAARPKATAKPRKPETLALEDQDGIAAAEKAGVRLTSPDRVVFPGQGVTKAELVAYYAAVAPAMLPYVKDRPLSLLRCPQGRTKYCFFQKHDTGGFPDAIKSTLVVEKDGSEEDYFYVTDLAGLIAGVQMNVLEFHLWGARRDLIEKPERIIFDIDPDEGLGFEHVRQAAFDIRDALSALGLQTFPMVTGGKGVHVIAPLARRAEWPEVKAFCKAFANHMADAEPDRFTAALSKARRKGRMFIDYLRNERGSTAIAPFSTRSREGAPVAVPVSWDELTTIPAANAFGLGEAAARAGGPDPWKGYFDLNQAITRKLLDSLGG